MADAPRRIAELKWSTRRRLEFIELKAYYTGRVSRSDVARAFGLSDPAATKDLKLYGALAPGNLVYQHATFGFVPSANFKPVFTDLDPAFALSAMAEGWLGADGRPAATPAFGIPAVPLPLPVRLPEAAVVAAITRAIHSHRQLAADYRSLSRPGESRRLLEPHALVHDGLRWHVRAFCRERYAFRDFVLARFVRAECLDDPAESSPEHDEDWVETLRLELLPHPRLDEARRRLLAADYGAVDGVITLTVRRALAGYCLRRLGVDTSHSASGDPRVYQLWLANREDVEDFAAWALV